MTAAARRRERQTALGALVAHPLRSELLTRFADRTASTVELANELGVDLKNLSYHVRALARAGAIEPVRERRVRGSVETFYRATSLPHFDTEGFAQLTGDQRRAFAQHILSLSAANAAASIEAGTLFERPDGHISRVPLRVDEEGWQKLLVAFDRLLDEVLEIKEESELRLAAGSEEATSVVSFATFFEMP
jgi:DNA-binding transcriptional ArsR family regulator